MRLASVLSVTAASLIAVQAAPAQEKKILEVTGKWQMDVQSEVGNGTPTVTFQQKGDSISGRYSSQALGERDFVGTVKDGKIEFGFTAEVGGQQFSMYFSGTVESYDAMKGTIDFGGMGSGTFSAKRIKPKEPPGAAPAA